MIRKGDTVTILTGKDVGKTGLVNAVFPSQNRVVIAGVNIVKRHLKKSPKNPVGGIKQKESAINRSNVMIICPNCKKPTRIGIKRIDGYPYRVCKKCGQTIDKKSK